MLDLDRLSRREIGASMTTPERPHNTIPDAAESSNAERRVTRCSFCGSHNTATVPMIEGPNSVYICCDRTEVAYGYVLQMRGRRAAGGNCLPSLAPSTR